MINQLASDTRSRLLESARKLFLEKGYGSTSIADILREAQANSGSLYHFFPAKQDLLLAVLETYLDGIRPLLLEPAWKGVDDPLERVFALLALYRELLVASDFTYGCPIGSLALELHEPDPAVRERLAANFAAWIDAVRQCLEDAGLAAGTDARQLAVLVLGVMEGAVMQARTFRSPEPFDACIRQLRLLLRSSYPMPSPAQEGSHDTRRS